MRRDVTKRAYIATRVLDIPLWSIYNMLPFILLKGLEATPFQLAVVIALKPVVSVLSLYWSSQVNERPDRLRNNIIFARVIGVLPFLIFPFVQNCWLVIISSALYMTMAVGAVPAWMELLKKNLSDEKRKTTFSWGSAFGYFGGGVLPLYFGWLLDSTPSVWQWIFLVAATISLFAIYFQMQIPVIAECVKSKKREKAALLPSSIAPLKRAWHLVKGSGDFAKYQFSFMIIGGGLMLIQPALYLFFDDVLGLSYVEFAVAFAFCKGASYAIASPFWARWMSRVDIFQFSSLVTSLACFFPLIVMCASFHQTALYLAYIVYGVMQAGSEMSWNMSGPYFAKNDDSSLYTGVNVLSVGLRGLLFPALGTVLCSFSSSLFVMLLGSFSMVVATGFLTHFSRSRSECSIPRS